MYLYLYLYSDLKNLMATALQGKARCSALNALPGCIAEAWPGTPACLYLNLNLYLYLVSAVIDIDGKIRRENGWTTSSVEWKT